MEKRQIKAVIFDLGETLLTFGRLDRSTLFNKAAERSYRYLKEHAQPVGSYWSYRLVHVWGVRLNLLKSWITGNDFNSLELLKAYGQRHGFNLSDEQWQELNWQWYEDLSKVAHIEPDAADALWKLRQMGLKVALLSNTFVHKSSLERHLAQAGMLEVFQMKMYSYDYDFRKPDVRIFTEAARQLNIDPKEVVYVGDRLDYDVKGSAAAGMLPVLKIAYTNKDKTIPDDITQINTIAELPGLLEKLCEIPNQNNETTNSQPVCQEK